MINQKVNSRSIYLEVVYRKIVRVTENLCPSKGKRTVNIGTIGKLKKNGSFRTGLHILECNLPDLVLELNS